MIVSLSVQPLPGVSLVENVAACIRDFIEEGRLQTGDRLPGELDWAERFAVSRSVIREAVGRLQSLGLVSVSRGRGRGITVGGQEAILCGARSIRAALAVSPKDAGQLQEFRIALEVHAARLAATHSTPEALADLDRLAAAIDPPGLSHAERISADLAFHRRIAELAGNSVMLNALLVSQALIATEIRENWRRYRGRKIDSHKAHRHIIAAIRRRDPDAAQRAMFEHIRGPQEDDSSPRQKRPVVPTLVKVRSARRRSSKGA